MGAPEGSETRRTRPASGPSSRAESIASTGTMHMKMPAKIFATSRIGSQAKPFSTR